MSSGQAGDAVTHLDPGFVHPRQMPITNEPRNDWFFEKSREAVVDPTFVVQLMDGSVYGHAGGQYLNRHGDFLWNLGREHWLHYDALFMESCLRLPPARFYDARLAVLAHADAYGNFAHWIFDVIPKIGLLERTVGLSNIDLFAVGHTGRGYQLETLQSLGIPQDRILQFTPRSHLRARELIVPSVANYNNVSQHPSTVAFLRQKFLTATPERSGRRLFISRGDASFRRLIGEAALLEKLTALGFEAIKLAGVSLAETARIFSTAEVVVGPFGSGLMNIVFCPPGCAVVEIVTPDFFNLHHWSVSCETNLRHGVYFGGNRLIDPGKSMVQVTKDITIDVDDCFEFIRKFLE